MSATSQTFEQTEISKTVSTVTAAFDRSQVFLNAKESLNFLAALCLPEILEYLFPDIHQSIWQLLREKILLEKDFTKLALGLPRGHAKTTLVKLFIIYCILFTDRKFILVICANSDLAANFLSDVEDMMDSPNIKAVFGDWRVGMEKNTEGLIKFSFLGRAIVLAARGKGSIRGLNIKNQRPDVMVMDDMQGKEDSESPTQAKKDLTWMLGTLMKLKDPKRCLYIYIGNMYATEGCILAKLKKNKNWLSVIIGAILSDGNPLWPELHSLESLMAEFENDVSMGHPEIFFAEVMNDPESGITGIININKIPPNPYEQDPLCLGRFVIIDVATDKIKADDTTIGLYGMYGPDIVFEKLVFGSFDPKQTIIEALKLALNNGASLICVEDVAYQGSLLFWFGEVAKEINLVGVEFAPVSPKGIAKNHRIVQWFKRLLPQRNLINNNVEPPKEYLSKEVRSKVLWQISQFNPQIKNNTDDILDNGAYAEQAVQNYGAFIAIPQLANPEAAAAKVQESYSF